MYSTKKILTKQDIDLLGKVHKLNIGFLGGSFDPPHYGHLEISKIALRFLKLDYLIWVINKQNPIKNFHMHSFDERTNMCYNMLINEPKIFISTVQQELKMDYTYQMVSYLFTKVWQGQKGVNFILGSDNFRPFFYKWKKKEIILKCAHLVFIQRPSNPMQYYINHPCNNICKALKKKAADNRAINFAINFQDNITFIKSKLYDISSSVIRNEKNIIKFNG